MKFEERQYQNDCVEAWYRDIKEGYNAVVAVPTAGGKTVILGKFIKKYIDEHPDDQVLVLSHTQHILEQDHAALQEFFPNSHIGLYSAGLDSRLVDQITVAGIQSIYKKADMFQWVNLIIVDEVHSVNHKSQGMYRSFMDASHGVKAGMSATVFRSGHGYIYEGKGTLFNKLSFDLTSVNNFNQLTKEGYLSELISVAPETQLDSTQVKKSAGDYNIKHLAKTHDRENITRAAVKDAIKYGANYNKWLVFAIDIDHADNIGRILNRNGIRASVLHSRMSADKDVVLDSFKNGKLRALVSVGMITTGFDAPNVDMILMLRPTMSASLHIQMIGRGLRVAPGKKHCLVLDYAGNTNRLGPINDVIVPDPNAARKAMLNGPPKAPTKTCPECRTIVAPAVRVCPSCGAEFQFEIKLTTQYDKTDIVRREEKKPELPKWFNVSKTSYSIHRKMGMPPSILVSYHCNGGLKTFKEWVCPEHPGYAGRKGRHWLHFRGYKGELLIETIMEKIDILVKKPKRILVNTALKYPEIDNWQF